MKTVKLSEVVNCFDELRRPISTMDRAKIQGNIPYYGANGPIDYINKSLLTGEYLLIAEDGSVSTADGHPVIYQTKSSESFWVSNHAHILQPKNGISCRYLHYSIGAIDINRYMTGAVQKKLTQANLLNMEIPFHTNIEQRHIVDAMQSRS